MTRYERIMHEMTIEKMAELSVTGESQQNYPDDIPMEVYFTEHCSGRFIYYEDAIQAEIAWLNGDDS
jgi:hypothetical protein